MPLIEISDVRKHFGAVEVLKGIDLNIEAGEVIAIIGKSGSGKTTLLRCINGLEMINAGQIVVAGSKLAFDENSLKQLRLKVGMIFQQFNLFPHLSAGRNVMLAQQVVKNTPPAEARAIAEKMLEQVGLAQKFDSFPDQLSGGQQQRVAISRALAMRPLALLCDEITSALDPELVGEVLDVMRGLAEEGMTMMVVTHEMRFARRAADRVVLLADGGIAEQGPPEQVLESPESERGRAFLAQLHEA